MEKVRIIAPFVGGAFGCKGYCWPHEILTAAAARELGRPLKIVLTRAQMYTSHGYQTGCVQHIRLGATGSGQLTAVQHDSVSATARSENYVEYAPAGTRALYACPAIETSARVARLDKINPTAMRAPHEGPGQAALEIAMDELAYKLGLDPRSCACATTPNRPDHRQAVFLRGFRRHTIRRLSALVGPTLHETGFDA